ncbi:MAG: TonB-dependent receptor [Prevotellaceae bacterium]|jgi:TonB-linked SusC/RagA family outer membrane protein|nr:TonB-dependent receptor [Prevotellaceae bacterium]
MKKITLFLVSLVFAGVSALWAQNVQISGIVTDAADGQPLLGVSVVVKGTPVSVLTGVDGRYTISVPADATLVFSFVGLETHEQAVAGRTVINVTLKSDAVTLSDVVVVAYGTTTKERFTGSVAVLKSEKLLKGETSNVTKILEGAVAGVQTASSTGQPGSSASIRVRGLGSISASSAPLIVVDGVPYEGSLNSIASQDIETLNVLKDAAATSMYGARGSNGVLLITTKRAETGKVKINFEARAGINSRGVPAYNMVTNPADFYELSWEAQRNNLLEAGTVYNVGQITSNGLIEGALGLGYNIYKGVADAELINPVTGKINPAATEKKWNESWLTDPFKNKLRQEYNLNVSSGTENTNAYFSAGYINDKGYIDKSDFSRINVRGKIDQKFKNFFKAGVNVAYAQTSSNAPVPSGGGNVYSNIFFFSQSIAPIYPIYKYDLGTGEPLYNSDGSRAYDFGAGNVKNGIKNGTEVNGSTVTVPNRPYAAEQNPLYVLQNDYTHSVTDNLSSRAYVELKFLDGFTFTANIAYDIFNVTYNDFTNPTIGNGVTYGGIGSRYSQRYAAINANQLLNYSKEFGKHKIDVLLGHEIKADEEIYFEGTKMQFFDPYNPELGNAGSMSGLDSYTEKYRLEGFLSRAEYSFDNRYMLSGSFRRDASSIFHPDVRWGNFWSVGAAWRAKEEAFLADVEQIDNLRLRASYGTQGNDAIIDAYGNRYYNLYVDQYNITSDGTYPSPVLALRGAPDLTWEKSTNLTIGFESRFFDRVTLNIDYFIKETRDMIYQKPLPSSSGAPSWIWDNQIDMKNAGWEFEVNVDLLKTADLSWSIAANLTTLKNELTKLPADKTDPAGYRAGNYWRKLGGTLYDLYYPLYAGVDKTTGKALWYKDVKDADGNITGRETTDNYSDVTYYETGKSALPNFYGGFSTDVTAYGFDLSIQTAFQSGGYVYDSFYSGFMHGGEAPGENWHTDAFKRWTPSNTDTDVPRLSAGDKDLNGASDRFLISASYLSLKNITLGYTFPRSVIDKIKLRTLRIYLSGDNLGLWSARKGLDPRQSFSGTTGSGVYSALRTVSVGLSIGL